MTRRGIAAGVVVLGIALMGVASVWAPPQPEFLTTGGSCEIAPCGELADPSRWHAAWFVWWPGAVLAVLGAIAGARAMKPPHWALSLLIIVLLPCCAFFILVLAAVVSWVTSVHGAWTMLVVGLALPLAYHVSSFVLGVYEAQWGIASRARSPIE